MTYHFHTDVHQCQDCCRRSLRQHTQDEVFKLGSNITYDFTLDIGYSQAGVNEDNYTTIGDEDHVFSGTFDGDGHTIKGIRIYKTTSYQGLFGKVDNGTIKNVNLDNGTQATILSESAPVSSTISGTVAFRREFKGGKPSTVIFPFAYTKGAEGTYEEKTWTAGEVGKDYGFAATNGTATDGTTEVKAGDFVTIAAGAHIKPLRSYLTYTGTDNPWAGARSMEAATLPSSISVVLVKADGETTSIMENGEYRCLVQPGRPLPQRQACDQRHLYPSWQKGVCPLSQGDGSLNKRRL